MDNECESVGQVRYDIDGNEATISISIDRMFRGKNYGSKIIQLASQKLFVISDVGLIHAYIKENNVASLRVFTKAGYEAAETTSIHGHKALHLLLRRRC